MSPRILVLLLVVIGAALIARIQERFDGYEHPVLHVVMAPWNVATRSYKQPWDLRGDINPRYQDDGIVVPVHYNAPVRFTADGNAVYDPTSKALADQLIAYR